MPATFSPDFTNDVEVGFERPTGEKHIGVATTPPRPGWKWAGDKSQPQRIDTDEYRRLVFLGELTPDGRPAKDGIALDQAAVNAQVQAEHDATMHTADREQIPEHAAENPAVRAPSRGFVSSGFAEGFG